jgi:hypothetical protein
LSPKRRIALLPGLAALADGREVVEETAGSGWDGSLAALEAVLKQRPTRGPASIVLSQHFVRTFLLSPPAAWLNRSEMQTWLADQLSEALGGVAGWHLVWQRTAPGRPVPVGAIERTVLDRLHAVLAEAGLKPKQIVPWQTLAYQRRQSALSRVTGWYTVLEPGMATLMRLERGRVMALRQRNLGDDPVADLGKLLGREALLNDLEPAGELWLDSVGLPASWHRLTEPGRRVQELPGRASLARTMLAA